MRTLTLQKIESVVKSYGIQAGTALLASLAVIFKENLIKIIFSMPKETLAETVFWLSIAALCLVVISGFYIIKSRFFEKKILKIEPDFYQKIEFDSAYEEAIKDK